MEDKLETILSEQSKEREVSYRKGSIPLTDTLDSTAPLSNIIIESLEEAQEVDSDKAVNIQKLKNGGEYKGDTGDDHIMHGSGQYQWPDGLVYKGEFTDCHVTGDGSYQWPDGSCYTGQVIDGLRNGWGCFKCANSSVVYTGEWKDTKRHGKGKIVYDEEGLSYYEGDWKDHLRHGKGYRRYNSGNVYEGEWCDDKRHGLGTMYWHTTNEQYSGHWRHGIQDGHGEHIWFMEQTDNSQYPLCNRYIGNWSNGLRHGFGTFYYASGAVYEGEWHHNKKHGKGWYMSQTGVVTNGLFRDDQLVGEGLDRPVTPISRLTAGSIHSGGDNKDSECGSNTEKFIQRIKPLLPERLNPQTEFQQVYYVILCYISQLKKIYHYYANLGLAASSDIPYCQKTLSRMQLWQLLKDCQLCQIGYNLIEVDGLLLLQDYSPTFKFSQHDPSSTYLMREYLQLLVSVSHNLFRTYMSGESSGQLAQCLDKLLTGYVLKYACKVGGLFYQPESSMYHMILSTVYQAKFWEVYQIVGSKKGMVSMRDFLLMMMDCGVIGINLSSSDAIEYITYENSRASTDPPHCYNLEVLITYLEFCEGLIRCALRWQSRCNQQSTIMSPPVPTLKVESTHSNTSGVGSGTLITQKSSHGLTGNKQLAQGLPAHQASRTSVESASSLSGRRAAADHPPAVTTTTGSTVAKGNSKTDVSSPPKIPSKHSIGLALSPIEETKSNASVVNTPTSGPADESNDKGSHDQPNTPTEQDEMTICQEAIKTILEEYIFPHYGITLT